MNIDVMSEWEARDLAKVVMRVLDAGGKVTPMMCVEWKRGRGMRSSFNMADERKRAAWVKEAVKVVEAVLQVRSDKGVAA